MTSGHDGGQYGGQPPAGPPGGQGQPPAGWGPPGQPPYGQQQPYGYAPAPSAPTGHDAPAPVERPVQVRIGIGAFVASLIIGVISAIVSFADIDGLIDEAMRASAGDPAVTEDVVRAGILIGAVIGLILFALQAMFLWFAWNGRNWARIVLWVLGGIGVTLGLLGLAGGAGESGFLTSLGLFQLLLTVVGIVFLALKPANDWYRYEGWRRAAGQSR